MWTQDYTQADNSHDMFKSTEIQHLTSPSIKKLIFKLNMIISPHCATRLLS